MHKNHQIGHECESTDKKKECTDLHEEEFSETCHVKEGVIHAYTSIANYFHQHCMFNDLETANLNGSPERVAKALFEMILTTSQIDNGLYDILQRIFPWGSSFDDRYLWPLPIIQSPIVTHSMCPHHFLPVTYKVTYGYLAPEGSSVLGLSKLTRIAKILAKRPILQEQYTRDLVTVLTRHLIAGDHLIRNDKGEVPSYTVPLSGAVVTGVHSCMLCRGVESTASTTTDAIEYSEWFENNSTYGLAAHGNNISNDLQAKTLSERLWHVHNHDMRVL